MHKILKLDLESLWLSIAVQYCSAIFLHCHYGNIVLERTSESGLKWLNNSNPALSSVSFGIGLILKRICLKLMLGMFGLNLEFGELYWQKGTAQSLKTFKMGKCNDTKSKASGMS